MKSEGAQFAESALAIPNESITESQTEFFEEGFVDIAGSPWKELQLKRQDPASVQGIEVHRMCTRTVK